VGYEDDTLENLQRRITDRLVQPFTYKYWIIKDLVLHNEFFFVV
jgi:hypothetical protein